jgi:hypothetical protein
LAIKTAKSQDSTIGEKTNGSWRWLKKMPEPWFELNEKATLYRKIFEIAQFFCFHTTLLFFCF